MTQSKKHGVLFVHPYTDIGGGETALLELATALRESPYSPAVACPREGPLTAALRERSVPVEIIPYHHPGRRARLIPWWAPVPALGLLQAMRRHRARIVCASDPTSCLLSFPTARFARRSTVFWCHGWWVRPSPANHTFFRLFTDRIVTAAQGVAETVGEALGPDTSSKLRVVPYGIDLVRFSPDRDGRAIRQEFGIPSEAPVVAVIARFQAVKGQAEFLSAAEMIAQALPQAVFLVVGDTAFGNRQDEEYKHALLTRVEHSFLLHPRVRFLGFRPDIPEIMAACDVIVMPSQYEAFPVVAIEAMACGRALVATAVGGLLESVVDGVTGVLVPPAAPQALAEGVLGLLQDPALRRRMGVAGRARAVERFSLERQARTFVALFDELVHGRGPSRGAPGGLIDPPD